VTAEGSMGRSAGAGMMRACRIALLLLLARVPCGRASWGWYHVGFTGTEVSCSHHHPLLSISSITSACTASLRRMRAQAAAHTSRMSPRSLPAAHSSLACVRRLRMTHVQSLPRDQPVRAGCLLAAHRRHSVLPPKLQRAAGP
jgi:hypothetical protein